MEISFFDVLTTVFSLVVLLIPGFIMVKTKMLGEGADKVLSTVVLYVGQPLLIFMGFQKAFESRIAVNLLITIALAVLVHAIVIAIMFLIVKNKSKNPKLDSLKYATIFGNCGYMGIPFIQTLYQNTGALQSEMLIYCAGVVLVFNILNWTVGVFIYAHDKKVLSIRKILINPNIIAAVLGFLMFIIVKVPMVDWAQSGSNLDMFFEKLSSSLYSVANLVTPLSMFVIGMKLANVSPKRLFTEKWAYVLCLNKLVGVSLLTILIVAILPVSLEVKCAIFFLLSMPAATSTALFAVNFGGDGETASIMVLLSTVLSIITISLMFLLFRTIVM